MSDNTPARAHVDVEGLLAECDEVRDMARDATRSYKDRNGRETEFSAPDLNAMLKATELKAKLVGLLGDGRQMTRAQVEQELDRMGYRLVEKLKKAG